MKQLGIANFSTYTCFKKDEVFTHCQHHYFTKYLNLVIQNVVTTFPLLSCLLILLTFALIVLFEVTSLALVTYSSDKIGFAFALSITSITILVNCSIVITSTD